MIKDERAPKGRKKLNLNFLRPFGAFVSLFGCAPTACAVGYILAPLAGARSTFRFHAQSSYDVWFVTVAKFSPVRGWQ
jgi:hypothetical protein